MTLDSRLSAGLRILRSFPGAEQVGLLPNGGVAPRRRLNARDDRGTPELRRYTEKAYRQGNTTA